MWERHGRLPVWHASQKVGRCPTFCTAPDAHNLLYTAPCERLEIELVALTSVLYTHMGTRGRLFTHPESRHLQLPIVYGGRDGLYARDCNNSARARSNMRMRQHVRQHSSAAAEHRPAHRPSKIKVALKVCANGTTSSCEKAYRMMSRSLERQ
jgi:hypothetical protein